MAETNQKEDTQIKTDKTKITMLIMMKTISYKMMMKTEINN